MQQYGFDLIAERDIPEINARVTRFRHAKSGAELLSVQNNDENKAFGISFRTPPTDSTGVPHILEHSALCGSRKYPLKDPFVELVKGSLNTFLNAMTYPDKTSYPVASQNVKDLYNLIDVYLDAVFYPRITPEIFAQEGWHYELEDPNAPLVFKGVVFNEMKGAYSSPDDVLHDQTQRSLFPDTAYGVDSGGNPADIPNLTYARFKAFHQTYYHPSNALLFFYGDDDPAERLRYLNEWLKEFDAAPVAASIAIQPPFAAPRKQVVPYDAGEEGNAARKGRMTVNWLLSETTDIEQMFGLMILDHILVGTPASPLRKALIDSGLGEDVTGGGMATHLRQAYFSTGLKGMAVEDAEKVEHLILATLQTLAADRLEPNLIEAAVNTTEFMLREQNTGGFPRGLALMFTALTTWLHGHDPIAPLAFEQPLQTIKRRLQSGERYFEQMIAALLLENPHRTTIILRPDAEIGARRQAEEDARLAQIKAAMTPADIDAVITQTKRLKAWQETPDSPELMAKLPMLTLADMEKQSKRLPLEIVTPGAPELLYHDLFTNGIVYVDLAFDLRALPQELVPFAPIFGKALINIGTDTEDFVALQQRIGRKTGGIWTTTFNSALADNPVSAARLILRGKATVPHVDDLLAIFRDMLLTVKLDNQARFKQMVFETKARKESSLIPHGSGVVATRLSAHFHESGWFSEQTNGVNSLFFIRQLAEDAERDWPAALDKLETVRRALINRNALTCNVTVDAANRAQVLPKVAAFADALPAAPTRPAAWTLTPLPAHEGLTIPASVNYVAKGANLFEAGYRFHGSALVIANYLRLAWLWEKVRVQGGAYGGNCSFDRRSGLFSFTSYRDPNLLQTLDIFDQTARFLRETPVSDSELTKSIIGVIGQLDDYMLPDAKGYASMVRHLLGESDEFRQQMRDEVLATTAQDFRRFADALESVRARGLVVVMGSPDAIRQANAERGNWLEFVRVL